MTIHTVTSLKASRRRLDRRRSGAAHVITKMMRGAALHLTYSKSGSDFVLTDGTRVASDIATLVVNDLRIVCVNDGLFPATLQTWRYVEP
jgi:hypothetical protein